MRNKFPQLLLAAGLSVALTACDQAAKKASAPAQPAAPVAAASALEEGFFTNPIIPNGADPWLEYYNGNYYLTTTTWTSQLVMRKSPTLAGLATATPINIWSESEADRCCNFWAFEFHRLMTPNGYRWYVMYTSGTKDNFDGQHLSVIESEGDDPMGPYTYKGSPMPKTWNIDGTYLTLNDQLYMLWSEWEKDEQKLWISKMSNPWTITGEKMELAHPTYDWEKSGMKVNEGPEVLQKDGKTFVVYSASFCNTPDYKLGVIEFTGADPMKKDSWHKHDKPFFEKGNGVFGPGHNGFFKSPDGKEDWLVYHGNAKAEEGCGPTRALRAQKFEWSKTDGKLLPAFGTPVASGEKVKSPSGENAALSRSVEGTKVQIVNKGSMTCITGDGSVAACAVDKADWTIDYAQQGHYRFVNAQGKVLSLTEKGFGLSDWANKSDQLFAFAQAPKAPEELAGALTITAQNKQQLTFGYSNCQKASSADCAAWRIQPVGNQVISSVQSGKVVTAIKQANKPGATPTQTGGVEQDEWKKLNSQRWVFSHTSKGLFALQNADKQCLMVHGSSIVPGMALTTGGCGEKSAQWRLEFLANGTQRIVNAVSNLPIDVPSCAVANHTPLAQAPEQESICQQFVLKSVK